MHYYHIEQPGSKGGVGMWRDSRWILLPRLGLVVFGLDSCYQTAFPHGPATTRSAVETYIQSSKILMKEDPLLGLLVTWPHLVYLHQWTSFSNFSQ